ncbi:MAG: phosphoribosylaminoimidazolesuccinocarboxamide synthase [Gemmatimonadota bacterium]|nr:phosphoribosylaminoimidazolesuccinocarboxamide synthase [Gemmatimonadota bacterium]
MNPTEEPRSERAVTTIELPLPHLQSGKVREMYALGDELLMVATDRLSAFDIVFEQGIPDKGRVLNGLSDFWFDRLEAAVPHHRLSADVDEIVSQAPSLAGHRVALAGRSMRCLKAETVPIECVVRGYLDGSGWREYRRDGTVTGIPLPDGLERGDRLPEPIFTPATKAEEGHDENIDFDRMVGIVGGDLAEVLRDRSLSLYREAADHAAERGLILADTKFEFGPAAAPKSGERPLLLIDEVLTPDSSRFWDADEWAPGGAQKSFDKQPVRDFLEAEKRAGRWDGEPPLPALSADAVRATTERYREAYRRLTGRPLPAVDGGSA